MQLTNKQKTILTVALLLILLSATGCVTWYYKQFAFSASPPKIDNGFTFRNFDCIIGIDAKPNESGRLSDSSYTIWICISVNDSITCDNVWDSIIGTMEISNSSLLFAEYTTILHPKELKYGRHPCQKCWDSENIIIPEAVDTLVLDLQLTYIQNGLQTMADTSVELYRFQGKQKHMISF